MPTPYQRIKAGSRAADLGYITAKQRFLSATTNSQRAKLIQNVLKEISRDTRKLTPIFKNMQDRELRHDLANLRYAIDKYSKNAKNAKTQRKAIEQIKLAIDRLEFIERMIYRYEHEVNHQMEIVSFSDLIEAVQKELPLTNFHFQAITKIGGGKPPEIRFRSNIKKNNALNEISCDKWGIRRILRNLLDNASKAVGSHMRTMLYVDKVDISKFRPEIGLSVDLTQKSIRIIVQDNGCGFPSEQIEKYNKGERFTTKDDTETHGWGLASIRKLVNAHNGTIRLESQENKGTRFTIEIPLRGDLQRQ